MRLATLLFVLAASPIAKAGNCNIVREVGDCTGAACAREAFEKYKQSQMACEGFDKDASPFVAMTERPQKGTVVLVHGLLGNPAHMWHMSEELTKEGYNVVVPILKGHGAADEHLDNASLEEWKKDVAFAGDVGAKLQPPLYLIGHSTGGVMASLEASARPSKYKAVVTLDPAMNFNGKKARGIDSLCRLDGIVTFPSDIPKAFKPSPPDVPPFPNECTSDVLETSGETRTGCLRRVWKERNSDFLSKLFGKDRNPVPEAWLDPAKCERAPELEANSHAEESLRKSKEIVEWINRYCSPDVYVPPVNTEATIAAACALRKATLEMTSNRLRQAPPTRAIISRDKSITDFINQDMVEEQVNGASQKNQVIHSKAPNHGLMTTKCSPSFNEDMANVKRWLAAHR